MKQLLTEDEYAKAQEDMAMMLSPP